MSLSKKRIQDKIEIVGKFKTIQVRYQDQIIENGKVISSSSHRDSINCGDVEKAKEHNVEKIGEVVWTSDIKKAYQEAIKQLPE
tara:strand:+ start:207 stop:458 length:252 start_codon:yes stop_codon:yes gene_type:complete